MIKRIIIFILIININTFAEASIKDEIILNFKKINNLSFNFKQNINENIEEGNCIIQYPMILKILYLTFVCAIYLYIFINTIISQKKYH